MSGHPARRLDRWVARGGWAGRRHRRLVWVGLLLAAVLVGGLAASLPVDPSIRHLLPEHLPSQRALREAERRVPLASPLYVAVTSSDPAGTQQVVRAVAERLRQWPQARSVVDRRDPGFFLRHRLLYVPSDLLEELADALEERLDWERCERLPGCVNLEPEAPEVPIGKLRTFFREDRRIAGLLGLLGADPEALERAAAAEEREGADPATEREAVHGRLCSEGGRTCVVQVLLAGEGSDLAWAERVLRASAREVRSALEAARPGVEVRQPSPDLLEAPSEGIRVQFRGRLRNLVVSRGAIGRDLTWTTAAAVLLVAVVLLLQFRGWRAFVALFGPMVLGFALALGLLRFAQLRLNLVSAATLSVLVGVGIDFGIHLVSHQGAALADRCGRSLEGALGHVYRRLLPSLGAAALTTAVGFGALLGAEFQGFAQMGLVALVGVLSVFVAYVLGFPLVVGAGGEGGGSWLRSPSGGWLGRAGVGRSALLWTVVPVLLAAGGLWLGRSLHYETDYKRLQPTVRGRFRYARSLHGTERSPVLVLADSPEQLREAVERMRRDHPDGLDGEGPGWLVAPDLFVPTEQTRKLQAIARMREATEALLRHARGEDRSRLERVRPWLQVRRPVTPERLPGWVHDLLSERDGRFGTFAVAYARLRTTDAGRMEQLARTLSQWRTRYGVRFASFAAVLGEVQASLRRDTPRVVAVALLGLLLVTSVLGRSLVRALWVTLALALSAAVAVGAMVLLELWPNLYNVPVLPAAFGMGVDGAIYVVWGLWRGRGHSVDRERLALVRRAVAGATLTTLGAFASLLLADSPGLRTLGEMAVLTLSATLLVNLLWLPAALQWAAGRQVPRQAS